MTTREKATIQDERSTDARPAPAISIVEIGVIGVILALIVGVLISYNDNLLDILNGLAGLTSGGLQVLILVLVPAVFFVAAPALAGPDQGSSFVVSGPDGVPLRGTARQNRALEIFYAEKSRLLRAIRDLDFDYDMGKLTDAIYTEQRVTLVAQAIALLQRIDALEAEILAQQERVEAALAAYRGKRSS